MVNRFIFFCFFIYSLCISHAALAAIQVNSSVSPKRLHPKDSLTLTVSVQYKSSEDISSPRLPDLNHFNLVGQSESHNVQINNLSIKKEKKFHYVLQPKKQGHFTIGSVEVVVSGNVYKTDPVTVEVSDSVKRSSRRLSPDPFALPRGLLQPFGSFFGPGIRPDSDSAIQKEDVLFRLNLSKKKVYVGEMMEVQWVLYVREDREGMIINASLNPSVLNGFWVESVMDPSEKPVLVGTEDIGGAQYRKYLLASSALVPLRVGRLKIGGAEVAVQFASGFSVFQPGRQVFEKKAQDVTVEVQSLPPKKNNFFTEAVGDFIITASVGEKNVVVNDSLVYKVTFKGRGHPRFIRLPSLNFGSNLELYDQAESQKFSIKNSVKEYEMIIIPRQVGKIVVPSFELSTFDPDLSIYKTHILPSFTLQVRAAKTNRGDNEHEQYFKSPTIQKDRQQNAPLAFLSPQLLDAGKKITFFNSQIWGLPGKWIFWIAVYSVLFILFIYGIWRIFFIKEKIGLSVMVEKYQRQVNQAISQQDWKTASVILLDLIYLFLSELVGQGRALRNLDVLLQQLSPSLRKNYASDIRQVVDNLERVGFAPAHIASRLRNRENMVKLKRQTFLLLKKLSVHSVEEKVKIPV